MGRRRSMGAACFAVALALVGCAPRPVASPVAEGGPPPTPSWLPPYSPAQAALLAPHPEPVPVPARPTYPALGRFRHAREHVLDDPRAALRVTRLVAQVVDKSPRLYALSDVAPELSNAVAQYGPAAEPAPDAFSIAVREPDGELRLEPSPRPRALLEALARGASLERRADRAGAIAAYREALAAGGRASLAPRLALARALETAAPGEAEGLYEEVVAIDPTLSTAHEGLAALHLARGDMASGRRAIARALALHPPGRRALSLAARLAAEPSDRVPPFAIFLEVDATGAVRVGSLPTTGARMYAGCRAVMRYEPELRELLFDAPPEEPYALSAAEEMLCIEAAIGAHVAERFGARGDEPIRPRDDQTHALLGLAHTEGLLGYVMFEILGRHRPEHARTAPPEVHRATVAYVERHVLGLEPDPEARRWLAAR